MQKGMSALPPKADMCGATSACPLCANSGLIQCSKEDRYSITSSARASSEGDGDAEHLRGLEADDEFELGALRTQPNHEKLKLARLG